MAKVEIKKPIVDEIIECLNGAKSAVLADYRGLTVEQDTALRKKMREAGVIYKVYKNTMIKRAVAGTEFESLITTKSTSGFFSASFIISPTSQTETKVFRSKEVAGRKGKAPGKSFLI